MPQEPKKVEPPAPQPPTLIAAASPHVVQVSGLIAAIMGFMDKGSPNADMEAVMGFLTMIAGTALHVYNSTKTNSAIAAVKAVHAAEVTAAEMSAPVGDDGECNSRYTISVAMQQAVVEENDELVDALAIAQKKAAKGKGKP